MECFESVCRINDEKVKSTKSTEKKERERKCEMKPTKTNKRKKKRKTHRMDANFDKQSFLELFN